MSDTTTTTPAETPGATAPERSGAGTPLFRNAYALMLNTGISRRPRTRLLAGRGSPLLESAVGQGSAAIAAMKFLAGLTAVTLTGALARFIRSPGAAPDGSSSVRTRAVPWSWRWPPGSSC
ncbi:hypothetical protein LT493_05915 [Streptomyces tricolor]|nr:hypothetical protein [Streptomyces tricolor]